MRVVDSPEEIYAQIAHARRQGLRVGVVPTMGALHPGHLSLVHAAKQQCDTVVATIFVNPSQFGPHEDFSKYPRPRSEDLELLRQARCDYVFVPEAERIYPTGYSTYVDPPTVAARWEGACRPGHFRGVATIVLKLFQMVPADVAFFGLKDYQQVAVISAMVRDLNVPLRVVACETLRDSDGLAMSSRNRYLSYQDRTRALGLYRALLRTQELYSRGETSSQRLELAMRQELESAPVDSIDYAVVVDGDTLEPLEDAVDGSVALIAARIGTTRLIDNAMLGVPS
jgi:pantoate--beta-alanine ligase